MLLWGVHKKIELAFVSVSHCLKILPNKPTQNSGAWNKTDDSYESTGWLIECRLVWWIFFPLWLLELICSRGQFFGSARMALFYMSSTLSLPAGSLSLVLFVAMAEVQRGKWKFMRPFRTQHHSDQCATGQSTSQLWALSQRSGKYSNHDKTKGKMWVPGGVKNGD